MPEGLSSEDNEQAAKFYAKESRLADALGIQASRLEKAGQERDQNNSPEVTTRQHLNKSYHEADRSKSEAEDARDANLWRSHLHKEAHKDEYMEQGKIDALEHKDKEGNPDPLVIDYEKDQTDGS